VLFADAFVVLPVKLAAASGRAQVAAMQPRLEAAALQAATLIDVAPRRDLTPRRVSDQQERVSDDRNVGARRAGHSPADVAIGNARRALAAGRAGDARMLAERAVRIDPAHAGGYIVLAGALDALGDRAGMKAAFRNCAARARDALVSACRSLAR
jgi:hypothetical protein